MNLTKIISEFISKQTKQLNADLLEKKYARLTKHQVIYYSMDIHSYVGFTDQSLLFALLYKLGTYLNLTYYFTPIHARPNLLKSDAPNKFEFEKIENKPYSGIFDFMGFDCFFEKRNPDVNIDEIQRFDFVFNTKQFDAYGFSNLQDLINHLRKFILNSIASTHKPIHIKFIIDNQVPALRWLHKLPISLIDFDYNDIYHTFRKDNPWPDIFDQNKPKVLLHIRQGDTAILKTPWETYVQIWFHGKDAFRECKTVAEIRDHQTITVSDFNKFYSDLKSQLHMFEFSTQLHSDGFFRAFSELDKGIDKLKFKDEQKVLLSNSRKNYNDLAFQEFQKHPEASLFIGEEIEFLFHLMHAFYTTDIVIVGTQARMFSKQYAYSFLDGKGPLLISLHKKGPPNYNYFENPKMLKNCLFVNLDNYQISDVVEQIKQFLIKRYMK